MSDLKMETQTLFVVDAFDLEKFINKTYGLPENSYAPGAYCFQADQEMGNDTQKTFMVEQEELDKWEAEDLEQFKKGEYVSFVTGLLLTDLANRNLIPEGEYLVRLSY